MGKVYLSLDEECVDVVIEALHLLERSNHPSASCASEVAAVIEIQQDLSPIISLAFDAYDSNKE